MSTISASNAALTILQQTTTSLLDNGQKTPVDTILDIVAGRKSDAASASGAVTGVSAKGAPPAEESPTPRAVGGTISSEIPDSWKSAMGAAAVNGFAPPQSTMEMAKGLTAGLLSAIGKYNGQFNLVTAPTREEWAETVAIGVEQSVSRGATRESAEKRAQHQLTDEVYENQVGLANRSNEYTLFMAQNAPEAIANASHWMASTFGVDVKISYNEKGEGKLGAFDIRYGNGQTMLSYHEDGTMTTYNEDGSVMEELSAGKVRSHAGSY